MILADLMLPERSKWSERNRIRNTYHATLPVEYRYNWCWSLLTLIWPGVRRACDLADTPRPPPAGLPGGGDHVGDKSHRGLPNNQRCTSCQSISNVMVQPILFHTTIIFFEFQLKYQCQHSWFFHNHHDLIVLRSWIRKFQQPVSKIIRCV